MCVEFGDVEAGKSSGMLEIPDDIQQAFICKVYLIVAIQLLLTTIGAVAVLILIQPLAYFLESTSVRVPFFLAICTAAIIALCLLHFYHLANYLLLVGLLTAALTILVGLTFAVATGRAILGSAILTSTTVVNLTLYTFWAASKGLDFDFLVPSLFGAMIVIMAAASVQILYPLGRIFVMMYGCFGSIAFCGFIVCITDRLLIKTYCYDKYFWAAVCLYVDFINLFILFLSIFKAIGC